MSNKQGKSKKNKKQKTKETKGMFVSCGMKERFEDTKGVIRIRKSKKDRQYNGQKQKGQTTIYKTLHTKTKNLATEPH
jgi:hypothetical protein